MHFGLSNIVFAVTVLTAVATVALYCRRCERRRSQWRSRWQRFASEHRELDRELSEVWQFLNR